MTVTDDFRAEPDGLHLPAGPASNPLMLAG
jgi:hypothetical protein